MQKTDHPIFIDEWEKPFEWRRVRDVTLEISIHLIDWAFSWDVNPAPDCDEWFMDVRFGPFGFSLNFTSYVPVWYQKLRGTYVPPKARKRFDQREADAENFGEGDDADD